VSRINPSHKLGGKQERTDGVNKSRFLAAGLTAWLVIEIVVFMLIVEFIGLLPAILLGVATTLLGLADVKRLLLYIRSRIGRPKKGSKPGGLVDGGLQALGSFLLMIPGFVSDLAGLALKSPSIRAGVAERIRTGSKRKGPPIIDLSPNEWKNIRHERRAARSTPKPVSEQSPE
jgi:UPF0716 protein FxsA